MSVTTEDILQHWGVKGMKWGVRRDRNKPGGADGVADASEKKIKSLKKDLITRRIEKKAVSDRYWKETGGGMLPPTKAMAKAKATADREFRYAKEDYTNARILNKVNSKAKSKGQLALEAKYRNQGMNNDEATIAAHKHNRTRKILVTTGALALTAGAAYATYKIRDARVDKLIKAGSKLQTIARDSDKGVRDAFYTAKNPLDKMKYKGIFGQELKSRNVAGDVFKKEIKVLSDIKQASPKNAQKALNDLVKSDPIFRDTLNAYIKSGNLLGANKYEKIHKKASESIRKGIVDKNVYEYFNATLVDHSPTRQKLTDSYFKQLSKKGYNAIRDVNDSKYSGYDAINPIIAFNTSGKASVVNVRKLANQEIGKAANVAIGTMTAKEYAKIGAVTVPAYLGADKAASSAINSSNRRKVDRYRKDNPGTEMSYTEIVRMLERGVRN